jgi:hypothetical protein
MVLRTTSVTLKRLLQLSCLINCLYCIVSEKLQQCKQMDYFKLYIPAQITSYALAGQWYLLCVNMHVCVYSMHC